MLVSHVTTETPFFKVNL